MATAIILKSYITIGQLIANASGLIKSTRTQVGQTKQALQQATIVRQTKAKLA